MQRVTLIDNYDSFTFNLVHYLGELGADVSVWRNDEISGRRGSGATSRTRSCFRPVLARRTRRASVSTSCARRAKRRRCSASASAIRRSGRRSAARSCARQRRCTARCRAFRTMRSGLFRGLNGPFSATRYHSLIIERSSAPAELEISAESDDGLVMAVATVIARSYGVQFHPESIASEHGRRKSCAISWTDRRLSPAPASALTRTRNGDMESFKPLIAKVAAGATLTRTEAESGVRFDAFRRSDAIADGRLPHGAYGCAARRVDEITGAVAAMRAKMVAVKAPPDAIDIVGTGGDGSGSLNVSTLAAIIAAACGVTVAKHGNRAASSRSGAADTLAALGVKIGLAPDGGRALHPRGRDRLHDGADASRRRCAMWARRALSSAPAPLQSSRAALQSRWRQTPACRRLLRRLARADGGSPAQLSAPSASG